MLSFRWVGNTLSKVWERHCAGKSEYNVYSTLHEKCTRGRFVILYTIPVFRVVYLPIFFRVASYDCPGGRKLTIKPLDKWINTKPQENTVYTFLIMYCKFKQSCAVYTRCNFLVPSLFMITASSKMHIRPDVNYSNDLLNCKLSQFVAKIMQIQQIFVASNNTTHLAWLLRLCCWMQAWQLKLLP